MNLKELFIDKPLIIIQGILAIMFFVYFLGLISVKSIEMENSDFKQANVIEGMLVLKIEEEIKTKELSSFDKKIYKEGDLVEVLYNNQEDYFFIYNFYDYYKGLFYCPILFLFLSFLIFKDLKSINKKKA